MSIWVLCGFMGCGKTVVGQALSARLSVPFYDTDRLIAEQAGKTVSEIFAQDGEAAFRAAERDICRKLAQKKCGIVATGGGALTFAENVQVFRTAHCPIILIDTPLEVIFSRLSDDTTRPLFSRDAEAIKRLYETRLPLYRAAADFTVNGDASPLAVSAEIKRLLRSRRGLS